MNHFLKRLVLFLLLILLNKSTILAQYTNLESTKVKEVILTNIESLDENGVTENIEFTSDGIIAKFVNDYLSNLADDIKKEIDGDVQISFNVDAASKRVTSRRKHSPESVNQPSGFVVTCKIIADQLSPEMVQYLLDQKASKKYVFTYGPLFESAQSEKNVEEDRMIEMVLGRGVNPDNQRVYMDRAVQPDFPGGEKKLDRFLYENIIAPLKIKNPRLSKTLSFQFVVEKDGTLSQFLAIANRGTEPSLFALKVIESIMPAWIPAVKNGDYVRSQYILQIRIKPVYTEKMIQEIMNPE